MLLSVCRSCLSTNTNRTDVLEASYKQYFMELAGIVVEEMDGLPRSICQACAQLFTQFSSFREMILRNHRFLSESLEHQKEMEKRTSNIEYPKIKTEHFDTEIKVESCVALSQLAIHTNDSSQNESNNVPEKDYDEELYSENPVEKKKKKKYKKKAKLQSRNKKSPTQVKSTSNCRVIEVDPAKIAIIRLGEEEQRERHEREATLPTFLSMPYRCMKCYKGFNYARKLEAHIENWHKENGTHTCKICHRTLGTASTLAMHQARHDTLYQCRFCLQNFAEKKQAIAHYRSVHEGIEQLVTCNICHQSFRHRSTLNGHMRSRHPSGQRPTCDMCGKSFVSKDSLLDHLLIHSGVKAHVCSCGKKFRLKSELVVHSLSHAAAGQYHCAHCDKHFKTYSTYKRHMSMSRAHVDPEIMQAHRCSVCGRGFAARWQLRAHAQAHTGAGPKYNCTTCGAQIASRAGLRKHIRTTHLRIQLPKNYVCHACGKRFAHKQMLDNHIRTHTGEKPFACSMEQCGARFSQKSTLQTHIRFVHLKLKRGSKSQPRDTPCETSE